MSDPQSEQNSIVSDSPEKKREMMKLGVKIENLIISKQERELIALGDTDSFTRYVKNIDIKSIIWNEDYLVAVTEDKRQLLAYMPEIEPAAGMFFQKEDKRRYDKEEGEIRVWTGDYSPVEFGKADLLKFLKTNADNADKELVDAIKNLKIIERTESNQSMIALDDGSFDDNNIETTEKQVSKTNIPNRFSMKMPIVSTPKFTYSAEMEFEAKVVKAKDTYGNENKGKKVIQLRVTNARKVMRDLMENILKRVPTEIPIYYGKMTLRQKG